MAVLGGGRQPECMCRAATAAVFLVLMTGSGRLVVGLAMINLI